jgi:ferredoxin
MTSKNVFVDAELCSGHGACALVTDFYRLDDDGYNADRGRTREVPAGQEEDALRGMLSCPDSAIRSL